MRSIGQKNGQETSKRMIETAITTRVARKGLRNTCRTASFIISEEWKRDVAEIAMVGGMAERRELAERWKEHVKNMVDWLILCVPNPSENYNYCKENEQRKNTDR